jgi:lichenan operon transcriptional antiterminator
MAIHVHSLLQRIPEGISAKNPLTNQIKRMYPLIYDMAVFVAHELADQTKMQLNEEEISFIAYHIGAYFEEHNPDRERVSCTFLYTNYHDMHRVALARIRSTFGDSIDIVKIAPFSECDASKIESDIILTPLKVDSNFIGQEVVLGPILTSDGMSRIRQAINRAQARKRGLQAYSMIQRFTGPSLFKRNVTFKDKNDAIKRLAHECTVKGLCSDGFAQEVLSRERMSSTAFCNMVAIPHSMRQSANRSFLSIVTSEKPMAWGKQSVNIVMLMGVSECDRKAFRVLFDNLLRVLSESANVNRLAKCQSYNDFVDRLNTLIMS